MGYLLQKFNLEYVVQDFDRFEGPPVKLRVTPKGAIYYMDNIFSYFYWFDKIGNDSI